jgi:hypothetical protein
MRGWMGSRRTVRDSLIAAVEHIGDTEMLSRVVGSTTPVS